MNIYHQEIFKRNFQVILFTLVSTLCGITLLYSLKTSVKAKEPLIIAIDLNGTRLVKTAEDPIFNTEALLVIKKFLMNIYNFNSQNFLQRIGFATNMMSESLWSEKRFRILDLKSKVETDEISFRGEISKISKDDTGTYFALIEGEEKSRMYSQKRKLKVSLKLKNVVRTTENPAGIEVDFYEEELLR